MTYPTQPLHPLIKHWRALAIMLVTYARLICRRERAGASGILEQVDQLEVAVRTAQVMVCRQIRDIPDTDEQSRDTKMHLCAIAATLLCLTVFLMTVRLRLRGGSSVGRAERSDARRADVRVYGGYHFVQPALRFDLHQLTAPP